MFKKLLSALLFTGMLASGFAQKTEVNEEGRRIVRYVDGSWRYAEIHQTAPPSRLEMLEDSIKKVSLALIQARIARFEADIFSGNAERDKDSNAETRTFRVAALTIQLASIRQALEIEIETRLVAENRRNQPAKKDILPKNVTSDDAFDLLQNPPKLPCNPAETQSDTPTKVLFRYTEKTLEPHFQNTDLLVCKAGLVQSKAGLLELNVVLLANTEKAPEIFGGMEQGAVMTIELMNGESLLLPNLLSDGGTWIPGSGTYLWRPAFRLGAKERKKLGNVELDKVTFRWSKVEQSFEVFDLDFFTRQADCLK